MRQLWSGKEPGLTQLVTPYRGTSVIRNTPLLGPYRRTIPSVILWSKGGGLFLMSEVLL